MTHFGQHLFPLLYIERPHIIPKPLECRLGYDQLAPLLRQEQLRRHSFALVQRLLQVFPRPTELPDQPIAVLALPGQLGSQSPGGGLMLLHLLLLPRACSSLYLAATHTPKASTLQAQALLLVCNTSGLTTTLRAHPLSRSSVAR